MPKWYDDLVERLGAERAKEREGKITIETIEALGYGKNTDMGRKFDEALTMQPKRRGRPPGSRNRPKT